MANKKYARKYADQLGSGLRSDGRSIEEVCQEWDIVVQTYNEWKKEHPEFTEAHMKGVRDSATYWHKLNRAVASGEQKNANAGLIQFALKNIDGINWADKTEIHNTHEEQITTIRIEVLPTPDIGRVIEGDAVKHLINKKPS